MSDLKLTLSAKGIWQVSGTVKIPGRTEGVRVRQSTGFTRLRDAEVFRDGLRREILEREINGPGHGLTFAECVLIYLEKGGEKRFMRPILERFGKSRVRDITAEQVSAFALENYGHLAPASVKRFYYTPLNAALNKGCKANKVAPPNFEPPNVERVTIVAAPRGWFPEFFQAAHFRIAVTVLFLTTTGRRVTEACRLTLEDLQFHHPKGPRAIIRKTKGGRPISVPLDPVLVAGMQRLIEADGTTAPDTPVLGYSGRWSVNQAIERVCKSAGIKYYSSHKLGRHAFASRLLDDGHSLKHVQDAGGWATIQIVADAYGHLEENATDAAVLDVGSQVSEHFTGKPLTNGTIISPNTSLSRRRKSIKSGVNLVGTTGIEPVTPTMSRGASTAADDD